MTAIGRIGLPIIALAVLAVPRLGAGEAPPAARDLPPAIGGDTVAVIRVEDPRWILEQLNAALGGNGFLATVAHQVVAEGLYNSRGLQGVDTARPALLAWRTGDAPMVAMIPVDDRERFLKDFGSLRAIKRLMIRTGEREGTIVYSQVTPTGTWEYRLMIREGYAYLARSGEECRLLAERGLDFRPDAPPLQMEWRGRYLAARAEGGLELEGMAGMDAQAQAMVGPLAMAVTSGWRDLLGQIALLRLSFATGDQGSLAIRATCSARTDTPLATWLSRQSNAGSRLLPLVTRPGDLLSFHGSVRWQGELERMGRGLADLLVESLGRERFTEQMDADLRNYFALLDRQGAFAASLGLVDVGDAPSLVVRAITEQPNSADLITLERGLDSLFLDEDDELGEFDAISGLLAYRKKEVQPDGQAMYALAAAARDHLLKVASTRSETALVEMRTLIGSLGETHKPEGVPAIAALRLDIASIIQRAAIEAGEPMPEIDALAVDLALRVDEGRSLGLELDLPLVDIQEAVARAGLLPAGDDSSRR